MNRKLTGLIVALITAACTAGHAAAQPAPAPAFTVDGARITKSGSGPHAIVLIPGLGSGAYAFDRIAPVLAERATVYTMTLPGFDGVAAVPAPYLPAFERSVLDLIAQEHLVKPVLIGHSLGGHLALHIAETHPQLLGEVIALDSLPLFPPQRAGQTMEQRAAYVDQFEKLLNAQTPDQYAAASRLNTAQLVTAPADVDTIVTHQLRGERAVFNGAAFEMMREDLNPQLAAITVPVLVVAPVSPISTAGDTRNLYGQLYAADRTANIVTVGPSLHFMMYDQPAQTQGAIDTFLHAHGI